MKEEEEFPKLPDPPLPSTWQRLSASPYFWWLGAVLLMGIVVLILPSQCAFDALVFPQEKQEDLNETAFVDQDKDLQQRGDGMWYKKEDGSLYSGLGVTFHLNGQKKTRTKFADGIAIGLIEEWDENGSSVGPRFKGEISP